jgi:hypothetical protein
LKLPRLTDMISRTVICTQSNKYCGHKNKYCATVTNTVNTQILRHGNKYCKYNNKY